MTIGILALQGDVAKHEQSIGALDVKSIRVRTTSELNTIDGLIIPGGESTTIGKLLVRFSMFDRLKKLIEAGLPVYGTCAGIILLAKDIEQYDQIKIGLLDITVQRNGYGPQIESFETDISAPVLGEERVKAVFIRAPIITRIGKNVEVLSTFENKPILVKEKNLLGGTFHPELAGEVRIHKYFIAMIG